MKRALLFASRNVREMLRDPLSYIFCLALPLVMLVVMYESFYSPEAPWFALPQLVPGIAVFGLTFVMLQTTLIVSQDRSLAFFTRLRVSPLRTGEFILGYTLPGLLLAVCQLAVTYAVGYLLAAIHGIPLGSFPAAVGAAAASLPIVLLMIGFGILFGTALSAQSAPGLSSIVISAGGFLSGAWLPVETLTGFLKTVCNVMPFYPAVRLSRMILGGTFTWAEALAPALTVLAWTAGVYLLAAIVFSCRARSDNG